VVASILEQCGEVSTRIDALEQREKLQAQAEVIEAHRRELESIKKLLVVVLGRAKTLLEDGCLPADSMPEVGSMRELIAAVRVRLASNPAGLASGRDYKKLLTQLEGLHEKTDATVTEVWAARRDHADPVDARLLERLQHVPGQAATVARIRALLVQLREIGKYPPGDAASLATFDAVAEELGSTWSGLESLGELPEAVVEFFRLARRPEGAPESLWTDEVRTWLEQHDMLGSVRVYFGKGQPRS
jgi:hypothetical protein